MLHVGLARSASRSIRTASWGSLACCFLLPECLLPLHAIPLPQGLRRWRRRSAVPRLHRALRRPVRQLPRRCLDPWGGHLLRYGLGPPAASERQPASNTAFVVIFLNGGADTVSLIVPLDCSLRGQHKQVRGGVAVFQDELVRSGMPRLPVLAFRPADRREHVAVPGGPPGVRDMPSCPIRGMGHAHRGGSAHMQVQRVGRRLASQRSRCSARGTAPSSSPSRPHAHLHRPGHGPRLSRQPRHSRGRAAGATSTLPRRFTAEQDIGRRAPL